ncbi:MAG: nitrous oxide reductase accessory protein NosL [Desulfomonilaceae bacterium]
MHTGYTNSLSLILALITSAIVSLLPMMAGAAELMELPDGSKLDLTQKCPVCGMVIGGKEGQGVTVTYKDGRVVGFHGVAAAVFKDGHVVGFEGARCLFIYNSVPEKYNVSVADIAHQYVTDFVSKKMIDLPQAFLVLGSNVKGPMGYDLIPFANRDEAAKFASENDGKWIVQLHEVTRAAQEEAGKIGEAEKGGTPTGDQKIEATPAPEASTIQPQETDTVRRGKRPVRQRDGGGHHMMH